MKKFIPVIIAAVVIAGAAGAYILTKKDNALVENSDPLTSQKKAASAKVVDACTLLTQADADAVLGSGATKGEKTKDTSTDDINVSTCTYTQASNFKAATILARSAKTSAGTDSNKAMFSSQLPASIQKIDGIGDSAYWDPTYGQLNILKNNNWYIVSVGGLKPTDKTLSETRVLADRVLSRM